jgi:hypothetical protein
MAGLGPGTKAGVALLVGLAATSKSIANECDAFHRAGYESLRTAEFVSGAHVGFGGETPQTVRELVCILERSDAPDLLQDLTASATKAGQLMALVGLHMTDRADFDRAASAFAGDGGTVRRISGCIASDQTVAEIVSGIEHLSESIGNFMVSEAARTDPPPAATPQSSPTE